MLQSVNAALRLCLAAIFFAKCGVAATYEFDYDRNLLYSNGEISTMLDFASGSAFDLRFTFDGEYLTSDNPFTIPALVYAGTRIMVSEVLVPSSVDDFILYTSLSGVSPSSYLQVTPTGFSSLTDWNIYDCRRTPGFCIFDGKFYGYLRGYGENKRESTYRVVVSSVPLQASMMSLLFALIGLFAVCKNIFYRQGCQGNGDMAE